MEQVLVCDVGKSTCTAALVSVGGRRRTSVGAGCRALADSGGIQAAFSAITATAEGLDVTEIDLVAAGVAGFASAGDRTALLADLLRSHFGVALMLTDDVTAWHAGALAGRPGVVVAAGTGAVALAVAADGRLRQADGWGYLLGDEGGGYWLGRQGLMSALRASDGRGGSEALRRRAIARYGALEDLPGRLHEEPVRAIASFSRDVADASREGDEDATQIWRRAGHALAETAAAAGKRAGLADPDVALTGGLAAVGDLLLGPFTDRLGTLCAGARVVSAEGDVLDGVYRLATTGGGLHAVRVRVWPGP